MSYARLGNPVRVPGQVPEKANLVGKLATRQSGRGKAVALARKEESKEEAKARPRVRKVPPQPPRGRIRRVRRRRRRTRTRETVAALGLARATAKHRLSRQRRRQQLVLGKVEAALPKAVGVVEGKATIASSSGCTRMGQKHSLVIGDELE